MLRFMREAFRWRTVRNTGIWAYQVNTATNRRRVIRVSAGGHQPIDRKWLSQGISAHTLRRARTAEAAKVIEDVLPTIPSESCVNVLYSVLSDRLSTDQLEQLGNLLGRAADEKRRV